MTETARSHLPSSTPAPLVLAVALALGWAPAASAHEDPTELPAVQVTASPLSGDAESLARPVEVLQGEALDDMRGATLGETVARLPGVQTSYFGPGVGRPILRGLDGPRVQVLSSGLGSQDASTVSADHAASVEPFLADQIEVLKGPATLLFGSGAIGGAVNVVDGRIATDLPDRPLSGRAELRGNTVNGERSGMFRLDGVNGDWVLHVDGLVRNGDDYRIPGVARLAHHDGDGHDDDDHDHDHEADTQRRGRLDNSSIRTRAGGVGATWLGEGAWFGLAASTYRSNYGIPDGAHVHADDDHDHDHDDDHGHDGEAGDHHVRVDMVQNRLDLKTGIRDPLPALKNVNLRAAYTDYEHVELEDGSASTRFSNRGLEGRLEAVQQELGGWNGAFGLQFSRSDFGAMGDEAFVPNTDTDSLGLFVLQEKRFGPLKLEVGGRHERVRLTPDEALPRRSFNATNLSAAGIWAVNPAIDLRFGVDSSERAPTNEELYAAGPHVATRSLEIGDAGLRTERGHRVELGVHTHTDRLDVQASVYQTRFSDFIYLADTGVVEDDLPVRLWTQQDATFRGVEAEALLHLVEGGSSGDWDLRLFGDHVHARLDGSGVRVADVAVPHGDHAHHYTVELANGGHLPRIAPTRFGAALRWSREGWRASLGAVRYSAQDNVAADEAPIPGYTLVDAHLAYRWERSGDNSFELFLDGSNLTNREVRPHTSLLRDYAPLPGRGVAFGLRAWF